MSQGILLAGGLGTRLGPLTKITNKHFLPIYDKPLIYYSLSNLILASVRKVVLVSDQGSIPRYKYLLGDGSQWGIEIIYEIQNVPEGIPQGISIASTHLNHEKNFLLMLGDNLVYGSSLSNEIRVSDSEMKTNIYCFQVSNPEDFGVANFDDEGNVVSLVEKPKNPLSNFAITGIYNLTPRAFEDTKYLTKSARGEYEIVDLLNAELMRGNIRGKKLSRGIAWLDAGSPEGILDSAQFVRTIQKRQGLLVGSPDESAWRMSFIDNDQFLKNSEKYLNSEYGRNLRKYIDQY